MPRYLVSDVAVTGGLYEFDSHTGARRCLLRGRFRGVTLGPDGWAYAVTGCRRHEAGVPTHVHRIHPDSGRCEDLGPVPFQACHDLRWFGDAFYLVASIGNLVIRLDRSFRETDRLAIVDDPADVCHVNCLAERDGTLYASIFTLSPGTRREKRRSQAWLTEGKLLRLDFPTRAWEVVYEPLAQPHSLVWRGDDLLLLESHVSRLTALDLRAGARRTVSQLAGFVRGLGVAGDEAVVGVTQMFQEERRTSRHAPWLARLRDRWAPFEGLVRLDPDTGALRRRYAWPAAEVYDILPLG